VGASKLRLENARKARLVWHWTGPGAPADFGDPVNTDAYLLCVYAPSLVATYAAPAGAGWQLIPDSRLDYRSRYGAPDGVGSAKLRATLTRAAIDVNGTGGPLVPPSLPLTTPVRVQLHRGGTPSRCWEATYAGRVLHNDAASFVARSDAP